MASLPSESRPNAVSAGTASDVKTFVAAVALTFGAGMAILVGAQLLGVFGGILGVAAAIGGLVWWKKSHGQFFPRDLPAKSVTTLIVITAALGFIAWLLA